MTAMQTVEKVYQAFAAGDGETLSSLLAETHWVEASGGPYGGTYQGFADVAENVFGPIGRDIRDFTAKPDELLQVGESRVLTLGRYRGTTSAGPLDVRFAHLWTAEGDRITHFKQFADLTNCEQHSAAEPERMNRVRWTRSN
jgi:ketosteroid isomerase-like protein